MYGSGFEYSAKRNTEERDQKEAEGLIAWVKQCKGKLGADDEFKKDAIEVLSNPYSTLWDNVTCTVRMLQRLQREGHDLDKAYGLSFSMYSVFFRSGLGRDEFERLSDKYKFESMLSEDTILDLIKSKYKTKIDGLSYQETDGMIDFTNNHKLPEWVTGPDKARKLLKGINDCQKYGIAVEVLVDLPEELVSSYLPEYGMKACLVYLVPAQFSAVRHRVADNCDNYNKVLFKVGRGSEEQEQLLLTAEDLFYGFGALYELSKTMSHCGLVILTEGDTVVFSSTRLVLL